MEPIIYKEQKHMADPKPKDPPFPAAQLLEVPQIQALYTYLCSSQGWKLI